MDPTVEVLEGGNLLSAPPSADDGDARVVLEGAGATALRLSEELLSRHILVIGTTGTGKTNTVLQLVANLRRQASKDDVFIFFDTKGDYVDAMGPGTLLGQPGDAIIANERDQLPGHVRWNLFADIHETVPRYRADELFEVAGTIFEEQVDQSGENLFFSLAARDVFASVAEVLLREGNPCSNLELRSRLEDTPEQLMAALEDHADLRGARNYLGGAGNTPRAVIAFMQQVVKATFSGVFRERGTFSVRDFVQKKGGAALFIEYDIAAGTILLPIYRVLVDLAIKEALSRKRSEGNVYFILDEFALLPQLKHITDGVNFGRSLGLKFIVGTQSTSQVEAAYQLASATSILSAFGSAFCFRVNDAKSRDFMKGRYGNNRKVLRMEQPVRTAGLIVEVHEGSVIEDWDISGLAVGQAIISLPETLPFRFQFKRYG